jgi:hypothetical protein
MFGPIQGLHVNLSRTNPPDSFHSWGSYLRLHASVSTLFFIIIGFLQKKNLNRLHDQSLSDREFDMVDVESKSLIPPPFYGTIFEDAAGWWRQFDNYCTYAEKTTITQISVFFAVLMRDGAAEWYESLTPPTTKNDLHLVFEERFCDGQSRGRLLTY